MIDDLKMTCKRFRLVIFSSMPPKNVARIMRRIQRDLSDVEVAGVLYEGVKRKTLSQRVSIWRKKIEEDSTSALLALHCASRAGCRGPLPLGNAGWDHPLASCWAEAPEEGAVFRS